MFRLLYVDDNPDDVLFFQEAVRMAGVPFILDCTSGPAAAIDYLDDMTKLAERPTYSNPALAVLDCTFVGDRGPNLLSWIRGTVTFRTLPVVILTGLDGPEQIAQCYQNGANYFLAKPAGRVLSRLSVIAQALHEYLASKPPCGDLLLRLPEYRPPREKPVGITIDPRFRSAFQNPLPPGA